MKLDMVGIITSDLKTSIKFYETLGFAQQPDATNDYVEMENAGVRFSINSQKIVASLYGYTPTTTGDTIELSFLCDSPQEVDSTVLTMANAGYSIVKEPWDAFWGQRYAVITDPDGHLISLFADA